MNSIEIWNDLGNLYFKGNDLDAAINVYTKALEQGYQTAEIYKNLADANACRGRVNESIPLYKKCIELITDEKKKALVFTRLGECHRKAGDLDSAIACFKTAIELEPGNPELCQGLNAVQRDLEKIYGFEESASSLESAKQDTVEEVSPMVQESLPASCGSESEPETGKPEMTLEAASESTETLRNEQGVELDAALGQESDIRELEVDKVTSSEPLPGKNSDFTSGKTEMSDEPDGQRLVHTPAVPVSALDSLDGETSLDGEFHPEEEEGVRLTLLLTLGIMHWRSGNLEEAEELLQTTINSAAKLKNNWMEALAWHSLALVKTALGDVKASIQAFLNAVGLAPGKILPWNNLGSLYSNQGSHNEAMNAFHNAIRNNPEDADSWDGLGDIYTKLGRLDDAIAAYQLGNVFDKNRGGENAIRVYEKALDFYKIKVAEIENTNTVKNRCQDDGPSAEQLDNLIPEVEDVILESDGQAQPEVDSQEQKEDGEIFFGPIALSEGWQEVAPDLVDEDFDSRVEYSDPENCEVRKIEQIPSMELDQYESIETADEPQVVENMDEMLGVSQIIPSESNKAETGYADHYGKLQAENDKAEFFSANQSLSGFDDQAAMPSDVIELPEKTLPLNNNDTASESSEEAEIEPVIIPTSTANAVESPMVESPVADLDPVSKLEAEKIAGNIASYEAVVKQNPGNVRAWDELGNLYKMTLRNVDAILAYEQAVILAPDKYIYHFQLGSLYAAEGNYPEALREVQKSLNLNPSFIFAHCALASYLRKLGRDEEAGSHLEIVVPFIAREKEYDRACFESIRGNTDKALELLTIALEKKQTTFKWIRRDLDLDFIRQDARYRMLEEKYADRVASY